MDSSTLPEITYLTKTCSSCKEERPVDQFYPRKDRDNEWHTYCKPCMKVRNKEADLKRKYGMSLKDLARMEVEQDFKCAICGDEPSDRGLFVDHDHNTGHVRGLLCSQCNSGLGMFRDNIETMELAIKYIEDSK